MTNTTNTYRTIVTDTFGGEANFSWYRSHMITAKTMHGAVQKLAQLEGKGWRKTEGSEEDARYDMQGACVCAIVELKDENY